MSATLPPDVLARERLLRTKMELAELAPTSMAAHATLFHTTSVGKPVIPQRHHLEWVRFAEDLENYRWVVVVAPPGYAKSTWFSIIYPAWRIGVSGGKVRIGLVSNTASLTYGFSRAIMRTIADPIYRDVYGVGPDPKRWAQAQFWADGSVDSANPTLMAAGIGGPIQGKRFDEIILDDPTTWDEARSDVTMEGQRTFLTGLLIKRFEPGQGPPDGKGRMIVVLTRWGERDLVPTLQDMGFKVVTMPAIGYWDGHVDPVTDEFIPGVEPLWPDVQSREDLERMRDDPEQGGVMFDLVMQGNPRALGGDVFPPENFQRGPMPPRAEFTNVVQFVDTAGGKDRERGDFFAMVTVGERGEETWVMDVERGRYPAPEQERKVIFKANEWDSDLVVIEDRNEGIALYQNLIEKTRLPLKKDNPVKDKEFRAIPLSNAYKMRKVWHPSDRRWVTSFEMELAAFPNGKHDDQVDAASGAYAASGKSGPRLRVLSKPSAGRRFQ